MRITHTSPRGEVTDLTCGTYLISVMASLMYEKKYKYSSHVILCVSTTTSEIERKSSMMPRSTRQTLDIF